MSAANSLGIIRALLESEDLMKRKGSQRGSIRARGKSWYITYSAWVPNAKGDLEYIAQERRVGPSVGPDRLTKREAEQQGYERYVMPANGPAMLPQGQATIAQFVEVRFQPEHIALLKKNGRIYYERLLCRHILPTMGSVKIADVTPGLIQSLIAAKIKAGLSTATVKHIRTALAALFAHAKRSGCWKGDLPTEGVKLPTVTHQPRRALTLDQVRLLVEAILVLYRPLILFRVYTGVRIGEALGLRWRSVNLTDEWRIVDGEAIAPNSILIHENWTRGERTTPKSRASGRKIPLSTTAWYALMLQRESSQYTGDE